MDEKYQLYLDYHTQVENKKQELLKCKETEKELFFAAAKSFLKKYFATLTWKIDSFDYIMSNEEINDSLEIIKTLIQYYRYDEVKLNDHICLCFGYDYSIEPNKLIYQIDINRKSSLNDILFSLKEWNININCEDFLKEKLNALYQDKEEINKDIIEFETLLNSHKLG